MNGEFIEKYNKIYIDREQVEETYNYNLLNNILSALGRYGYTLSIEGIDTFCKLEWNYRVNLLSNINKIFYEKSKKNNEEIGMFYINYPNEVKSQDKRELYINSLLFFYYNFWNSSEEEFLIDKPELTSDIGLKEIDFTYDSNYKNKLEEEVLEEEALEEEALETVSNNIIDNLEDMVEKIKNEDKNTKIISKIEDIERSLEEKEEERIVIIGEDDSHFNQMELFHTDSLPIFDDNEIVEEESEKYIDTNENQLNIFDGNKEEDPYTDDEEIEEDEFEEEVADSERNPYEDEEDIDADEEDEEEIGKYKNFSTKEVQEAFDDYEDETDELYLLNQKSSTVVEGTEVKKHKRNVSEIDSYIENRRYLKLLKVLKKEPNELTRRILFILEGINYKYEDREDRIEYTSKALGIFEGIVDEVNSDVLREIYYQVKDKCDIYNDKGLYKAYKELRKIIKDEIKDRSN